VSAGSFCPAGSYSTLREMRFPKNWTDLERPMYELSKSRILTSRQCPRRLWLEVFRRELMPQEPSASMAEGAQSGEVARDLFPDGALIDAEDLSQALTETAARLIEPPRPLFEATFQADGVLVRADLLLPEESGWRVVEVKSSTSVKDHHYLDTAVQAWVLQQTGLPVLRWEVAHIDSDFVYTGAGDYQGLFHHVDVAEAVRDLEPQVPAWIAEARATLQGDDPQTAPGEQCRDPFECPFMAFCTPPPGSDVFPPEILPHGGTVARALRAEGYEDLRDVPPGRLIHPRHIRVWQTTRDNVPFLDPEAGRQIATLGWPRYFLDFETIQFAVPIWAGTRPYQQIPFQWSCHVEDSDGALTHHAFLAEDATDPRRAFVETLLTTLGTAGPILVYNVAFERGRMAELAEAFPEHTPVLNAVMERLFDLLPVAREHYYHRDMRGSWSIKAVLPTIAPDLAYDDLEVSSGGMAQATFAEFIQHDTETERRNQLRKALLIYCERDTWAMVRIARFFQGSLEYPLPVPSKG